MPLSNYPTRRAAALGIAGACFGRSEDSALAAALKAHDVPGAQLCFVEGPKPPFDFVAGLAEKSSGRAVSVDTRFESASLSKPVFACAVLKLCEQGKMSLDAQLGELLPPEGLPDDQRCWKVSIRQILTHTSGIQPVPPQGRATKLRFAPGGRFEYSPHAFDFAQRAAERAASQPIDALVRDLVLEPLRMTNSVFDWKFPDASSRAVGYEANGSAGQTINERVASMDAAKRAAGKSEYPLMNFPNAAASLITTARDYANFLRAIRRPAPDGLLGERFTTELREAKVSAGKGIHWGLAFGLVRSKRRGLGLWHWGDFGVFQNFAVHFPDADLSLVSLTNGARGQRFNRDAAKLLLSEDLDCFRWLRV